MERFNLELTDEFSIDVEMAKTVDDRRKGLSDRDFVDTGMLFTFNKPGGYQIWMKDTKVPLSILFLNESGEVTQIATGTPDNRDLIGQQEDTKYVLELPAGFNELYNLEVGDALDIPPEADTDVEKEVEAAAELLDETGKKQMDIVGEERVFSIEKTAEIVDKAKNANTEEEIIDLAKTVADEIKAQDGRGDDYVDPNNTKTQYEEGGKLLSSTPYDDYLISLPDADTEYGTLRRMLRMQGFELTKIKTDPTSLF